jgi:hypothetical protein
MRELRKLKVKSIIAYSLLILLFLTANLAVKNVDAENNSMEAAPSSEANIHLNRFVSVERKISFLSGGYVMINDTFSLLIENMSDLIVGVPRNYSSHIIYYAAYDSGGSLPVKLMMEEGGFQWFKVDFMKPASLGNEAYNFTITYVFSGLIESVGKSRFHAVFPLYPSLREDASSCNVIVAFPTGVSPSEINYPSNVFLKENSSLLRNSTSPLAAYANASSWITFTSLTFKLLKFSDMMREIAVDCWGKITVNEIYEMSTINVDKITLNLPAGATYISVYDAYGIYQKSQVQVKYGNNSVIVEISLNEKLKNSGRARISLTYNLPFWTYITKYGWQHYMLNINLTKPDEWIIQRITVMVVLPEGASFLPNAQQSKLSIEKIGVFQEKASINYYNVTRFESLGMLNVRYQYSPFWAAFKPTLLFGVLIGLGGLAFTLLKSSGKGGVAAPAHIPPEKLKEFIEAFEERGNILLEIESLEQQSRRGKISRRQYKLMRKTLEERLASIQGKLSSLKGEIESAGSRYADMVRRLEMASAEIEVVKRNIADVDLRYRRGEISSEARRKLLEEYEDRRKRAENIIEETLLRFKEEII